MAGWRNGFPLCAECLSQQPPDAADRASESSTKILRDILIELRRIGRTQQPTTLSRLRLFAYMFQALALFVGLWGLFNQENLIFIQVAIFLQVLVVALLLLERKP